MTKRRKPAKKNRQKAYREWQRLNAKLRKWHRTDDDRYALTMKEDSRYFYLLAHYG